MFPNPQDALPLPPRPSLERYKKLAKQLLKAARSDDASALQRWAEAWVESLVKLSRLKITKRLPVRTQRWIDELGGFARRTLQGAAAGETAARTRPTLAGAQFVIARSHGFESWPKFSAQLRALESKSSAASRFEMAADAIVKGDAAALKRMLRDDPIADSRAILAGTWRDAAALRIGERRGGIPAAHSEKYCRDRQVAAGCGRGS